MSQYVINKNNGKIKERIKIAQELCESDGELMKIIKKSQMDAVKKCIPMNFKKVGQKVITRVYKIPNDFIIKREKDSKISEESKNITQHKKKLSNIIKNDDNLKIRRKFNFQFESFPLKDIRYYEYNQSKTSNNFYHKKYIFSQHFNPKRNISPPLQSSVISTRMNSLNNINNSKDTNSLEFSSKMNKFKSPLNNFNSENCLSSSLHGQFFSNLNNLQENNILNNSKIQSNTINAKKPLNDSINKIYDINQNNKTINCEKYFNKIQRIYLGKTFKKPYYTIENSYIIRSPTRFLNKKICFKNCKNIEYNKKLINKEKVLDKKSQFLLKTKQSKDENLKGKISSKNISHKKKFIKNKEEIEVNINDDEENDIKYNTLRNYGDNYKYLETKNIKNSFMPKNTFHCRRSPFHVFGVQNYIIKDNKRIYLKEMPKVKMLRLYRNNSNGKMTYSFKIKNRKFDFITNNK